MTKYEADTKVREKYSSIFLHYKFVDDDTYCVLDSDYQTIKQALFDVGVYFDAKDGLLSLAILTDKYIRTKSRFAGRKEKVYWKQEERKSGNYISYKYSDILYMMQTMTNQQIYKLIGIKPATYYRRKKKLISSNYYKIVDRNRLLDKNYLDDVSGNLYF